MPAENATLRQVDAHQYEIVNLRPSQMYTVSVFNVSRTTGLVSHTPATVTVMTRMFAAFSYSVSN